jgi:membrane fusion protein (multidrug efflux system)
MVNRRQAFPVSLAAVLAAALVSGCGKPADAPKRAGPPPVQVTATTVQPGSLEVYEEVVGALEYVFDPKIGAEVAGRVVRVLASTGKVVRKGELLAEIDGVDFEIQNRGDSADIARLESLLAQQERVLERQLKLVAQGFISQNAADDAAAQRNALREQIVSAKAKAEGSRRSLGKARVVAPIDGVIETQVVAPGDYVKLGDPLFNLVGVNSLRANLPLPESAASRIKAGLKVVLSSPSAPGAPVTAKIREIKPTVGTTNRALTAIVDFESTGGAFRGGGSVNARIVTAQRENAMMVPEQSVVLRPAGKVAYVLVEQDGKLVAQQRAVETGLRQDGLYEVTKGLAPGDRVVVDGAGFLTNNANVQLPKPKPKPEAKGGDSKGGEAKGAEAKGNDAKGGKPEARK